MSLNVALLRLDQESQNKLFQRVVRNITMNEHIYNQQRHILFALANFWPGFPSLGRLDEVLVINDDWGTYRGVAWKAAFAAWWRTGHC